MPRLTEKKYAIHFRFTPPANMEPCIPDEPTQLDRIEALLRYVATEPVGALGRFIVQRHGNIFLAETP